MSALPWTGQVAVGAPELAFSVEGSAVVAHAAVPMLELALHIDAGTADVRSLALHVQVRIAAPERAHDPVTKARLAELFGSPADWGRNVRSLLWLETSRVVPAFTGATTVPLRIACGYDFEVSAARYLDAVREGEIPLELLFSGSVFYADGDGMLRTVRLPWDREAKHRMPARLWREVLDRYYPDSAWLRVSRDVFDRLNEVRARQIPPTWEAALSKLLEREAP